MQELRILRYPDPRLRKVSLPVESIDEEIRRLTGRLFELMRAERGVGLAAPQVGVNRRLFVINPTGRPDDDRVYINPELSEPQEQDEADEGCLSLPKINVRVLRSRKLHMRAQNLDGAWFEEQAEGYVARIWQHENDHLDGILILDKMSPLERMASRKALRELEEAYAAQNPGWRRRK